MPLIAPAHALAALAAGFLAQWLGTAQSGPLHLVLGFVAGALQVYGCAEAAWAKGYSRWMGFFAILSFLGVFLVLMIPGPKHFRLFRWFRAKDGGHAS